MINICIACFFMAIGFLLRFSRRNGIDAWKWLFETIVSLFITSVSDLLR
jgi:hypothetical protein